MSLHEICFILSGVYVADACYSVIYFLASEDWVQGALRHFALHMSYFELRTCLLRCFSILLFHIHKTLVPLLRVRSASRSCLEAVMSLSFSIRSASCKLW